MSQRLGSISDQIMDMFDGPVTSDDIHRALNSPEYKKKCAEINAVFGLKQAMHHVMEAALGTDAGLDDAFMTMAFINLADSKQFEQASEYHTIVGYALRLAEQKPHLRDTVYFNVTPDTKHLPDAERHADAVARNNQSANTARQSEEQTRSLKRPSLHMP